MDDLSFMGIWQNIKAAGENKDIEAFDRWLTCLDMYYQMDEIVKYVTILGYFVFAFKDVERCRICLNILKRELKENYSIESKDFDVKGKFDEKICSELISMGLKKELDEVLAIL